ncbi:MAG: hypothetical protein JRJ04_02225 [Deltaproteobacteria bacterium]|nr:hypothetical protein [Deltaproteobacteria bacterium]
MSKIIFHAILTACLSIFPVAGFAGDFYLGGIQVNEPDVTRWVRALKQEHMNSIEVTAYAYQADWDTDLLTFKKDNPGLINEIRLAKAAGLHVVLILRTALDHAYPRNKFLWHGLIMPKTDQALESWFEKYTRFVLHWAKIAQDLGVDVLGVASEMNTLTSTVAVDKIPELQDWYLNRLKQKKMKSRLLKHNKQIENRHLWVRGHSNYETFEDFLDDKQQALESWARQSAYFDDKDPVARINQRRQKLDGLWRKLIARTRNLYHGKLTYAANFDQYFEVGFWDALDVMGINAYFPLHKDIIENDKEHLLEDMLVQGWQAVFNRIDAFCEKQNLRGIPILFTEIGYTRRKNCTIEPWANTGFSLIGTGADKKFVIWQDQPEYPEERALAIKALYRVARDRIENPLIGILYWKLSTVASHLDIEPFVCIIGTEPKDPLLQSLKLFATKP